MVKKLLLAVILCGGAAVAFSYAQPKPPVRASLFGGKALPTPPQHNAPWSHGDDALSKAAATLFDQGLPDPRGLEYREIEIAVGNPWNGGGDVVQTHGWMLPKEDQNGRFAIAWNGLVYPVLRVGDKADLQQDWAPHSKTAPTVVQNLGRTGEAASVSFAGPSLLKLMLLARLGEVEIVGRISKVMRPDDTVDPYLDAANDWAWHAFERAVCAHQRGDDHLALADAQLLTRIEPLIEAEATRRGFKAIFYNSKPGVPARKLPYVSFLTQLSALLADCQRRVANPKKPSPLKKNVKDIAALIEDLQNVDARQWGQPGGVSLAGDARVQALVKHGNAAVEPLLEALENDERLTRSVSFGRDFHRSRHLISVSEAAYAALVDMLRVQIKTYGENGESLSRKEMAASIRSYWAKMGALSPEERFYATLKDDTAGKDQWLQAAGNLVQPTDVEIHGSWMTVPNRKPNQKIKLRGESLRDGRKPSVAQLLARRSDDIAAIRTGQDRFLYLDAGNMALNLAAWDKTAAIPTLKRRLRRGWSVGTQSAGASSSGAVPYDALAAPSSVDGAIGTMIARMTLARARCGDVSAYDEYAAWLQKIDFKDRDFDMAELQKPLIQATARPSVIRALDYLFNDPQSPWSDVLAGRSGLWLPHFWKTPLTNTAAFRKQAARALADTNPAGAIIFNPRADWKSRSEAEIQLKGTRLFFHGSKNDPDMPPAGEKRSFRVCDACAYFYAHFGKGPKFQLFWPEKKRDVAVAACRQWLAAQR